MVKPFKSVFVFDMIGSSAVDEGPKLGLRRNLSKALQLTNFRAEMSLYAADGGWMVFEDCEQAYDASKSFLQVWIDSLRRSQNPQVIAGIRSSIHVGHITSRSRRRDTAHGEGLFIAQRLMQSSPIDGLRISATAFEIIKNRLQRDGQLPQRQTLNLPDLGSLEVYDLSVSDLLNPNQCLIRFLPPSDLILFLASHPSEIFKIPPSKFEEVVAEILRDLGYQVELTKHTRDNGIDIIAISRQTKLKLNEKYLVQCKRNAPSNKVGLAVVHELLGVGAEEPHTGLIIATTSTFTHPARDLAAKETVKWHLHLRDYDDIRKWLLRYGSKSSD